MLGKGKKIRKEEQGHFLFQWLVIKKCKGDFTAAHAELAGWRVCCWGTLPQPHRESFANIAWAVDAGSQQPPLSTTTSGSVFVARLWFSTAGQKGSVFPLLCRKTNPRGTMTFSQGRV